MPLIRRDECQGRDGRGPLAIGKGASEDILEGSALPWKSRNEYETRGKLFKERR